MSRLVESKGVYIAAEVARLLVAAGLTHFKLIVAGNGPEYKGVRDYISRYGLEDYIETPGYVTGINKQEILRGSNIFLFPTYYGEGCPIVVLEAMGAGLAVVSTPVAGIPDIVEHGKNGFLIDSRNPQDFYKAVKTLI